VARDISPPGVARLLCNSHQPTSAIPFTTHGSRDIGRAMNGSVHLVRQETMTRFGGPVEDFAR